MTNPLRFALPALCALALVGCNSSTTDTQTNAQTIENVAAPDGGSWVDVVKATPEGGFVMGNPDAPIKLVEYASLTCHVCAEFEEQAFEPLKNNYVSSGRVSFEVRNFIRDPYDLAMAMVTRCGGADTYFGLTEEAFKNQAAILEDIQGRLQANPARGEQIMSLPENRRFLELGKEMGLIEFFKARGISEDQASSCLSDAKTVEQLTAMTEKAATDVPVQGTPTFVINGERLDSPAWPDVQARLQQLGAR